VASTKSSTSTYFSLKSAEVARPSGWSLSRRATADLQGIRDYTVKNWGPAQAVSYLSNIRSAIEEAAEESDQHQRFGAELPGYFRIATGSHVLFYREVAGQIRVERILHRRMDFERHL
jgi:toxin ParE1/3/4